MNTMLLRPVIFAALLLATAFAAAQDNPGGTSVTPARVVAKAIWYDPADPSEVFGLIGPRYVQRFEDRDDPMRAYLAAWNFAQIWDFPAIGTVGPIMGGEGSGAMQCLETVRWPTPDDFLSQWSRCEDGRPSQQYTIDQDGTVLQAALPSLPLVVDLDTPPTQEFYTLYPRPNHRQKLDVSGPEWRN